MPYTKVCETPENVLPKRCPSCREQASAPEAARGGRVRRHEAHSNARRSVRQKGSIRVLKALHGARRVLWCAGVLMFSPRCRRKVARSSGR